MGATSSALFWSTNAGISSGPVAYSHWYCNFLVTSVTVLSHENDLWHFFHDPWSLDFREMAKWSFNIHFTVCLLRIFMLFRVSQCSFPSTSFKVMDVSRYRFLRVFRFAVWTTAPSSVFFSINGMVWFSLSHIISLALVFCTFWWYCFVLGHFSSRVF